MLSSSAKGASVQTRTGHLHPPGMRGDCPGRHPNRSNVSQTSAWEQPKVTLRSRVPAAAHLRSITLPGRTGYRGGPLCQAGLCQASRMPEAPEKPSAHTLPPPQARPDARGARFPRTRWPQRGGAGASLFSCIPSSREHPSPSSLPLCWWYPPLRRPSRPASPRKAAAAAAARREAGDQRQRAVNPPASGGLSE